MQAAGANAVNRNEPNSSCLPLSKAISLPSNTTANTYQHTYQPQSVYNTSTEQCADSAGYTGIHPSIYSQEVTNAVNNSRGPSTANYKSENYNSSDIYSYNTTQSNPHVAISCPTSQTSLTRFEDSQAQQPEMSNDGVFYSLSEQQVCSIVCFFA